MDFRDVVCLESVAKALNASDDLFGFRLDVEIKRLFEVGEKKHFAAHFEHEGVIAKGHAFLGMGQGEAKLAKFFDVHGEMKK